MIILSFCRKLTLPHQMRNGGPPSGVVIPGFPVLLQTAEVLEFWSSPPFLFLSIRLSGILKVDTLSWML